MASVVENLLVYNKCGYIVDHVMLCSNFSALISSYFLAETIHTDETVCICIPHKCCPYIKTNRLGLCRYHITCHSVNTFRLLTISLCELLTQPRNFSIFGSQLMFVSHTHASVPGHASSSVAFCMTLTIVVIVDKPLVYFYVRRRDEL